MPRSAMIGESTIFFASAFAKGYDGVCSRRSNVFRDAPLLAQFDKRLLQFSAVP